ncbi:hypothetical protein DSM106972_051830 [Dulcicalothrix desertica PCC 7102]|uniref:Uncharacterized protein n=1 Tax=Dulcicalothrix desertica PCC 7102 TaxID=232991 RepID=A0A3S1D4Z9_9CYAN|nr:hypothetical protein [Dulcicalothrix desertica]RUT03544.1 hypothetical protein DSM106972_051830 [Dulcicalothrix desertica PCC 7102]TWH50534.1 hypothetical protein CAL7102_04856 [Dulcicalothrix desertica PCC 7102]
MTDLIQRQKLFAQDDVSTRLSKIANNLGAIKREVTINPDTAVSLIRESLYFIEWTAPTLVEVNAEQATELVDLGRTLARWQYHWEKISKEAGALSDVATEAGNLSKHYIFS